MAIDRKVGLEIINEAKDAGFEDQPIPESDEDVIARAEHFYTEAKKIWEEQDQDVLQDKDARRVIQSIIWLGDSANSGADFSGHEERDAAMKETYPRRSSGGLSESDERETDNYPKKAKELDEQFKTSVSLDKEISDEHLPVPQHIEGDADPMPRDLTALSDKEIRRLSGEYNAYLARTTYLLAIESSDLANAEHLLDAAHARALRTAKTVDPKTDKPKLMKVIEAEILEDQEVADLTASVSKHQQKVLVLKALKEIYSGNVDRLSREWTMRQNEWEKSR